MFTPKQQEEIKKLKEAGVSILGISKQLNISRNTVYKYINAEGGQRRCLCLKAEKHPL